MKHFLLSMCALLFVGGCVAATPVSPPPPRDLSQGVVEPVYPPYCWLQRDPDPLWYPCGQHPAQRNEPPSWHNGHL